MCPLVWKVKSISALLLGALFAATLCGQEIDFKKEILPIFREHCFECHGKGNSEGGLSLESLVGLQQGGDSGNAIFTPKPSDSELYLRIKSLADGYRMPKRGEPLPQDKISKIAKWIFQNRDLPRVEPAASVGEVQTPAATTSKVPTSSQPSTSSPRPSASNPSRGTLLRESDNSQRVVGAASKTEGLLREYGISQFLLLIALTGFIVFLSCFFFHRIIVRSSKRTSHRIQRNDDLTIDFFAILVGAISAVMLVSLVLLYLRASQLTLENEILRAEGATSFTKSTSQAPIISIDANNLLLPPHPMHPPRLGGKYYRGNDERDESLFNGGFYRTATIDLNLASRSDPQLRWGESVEEPLFIEVQIRRAPKATREQFTNRIAELCSIQHYSQMPIGVQENLKFKVLEQENLWSVKVPLPDPMQQTGDRHLEGMIYLMYGTQPSEDQLPRPHFAIKYDLHFEVGKKFSEPPLRIGSDSVLWMGSMYTLNNRVLVPNAEQVLLDRWFDWRPIPEIEGTPSEDPSLLGTRGPLFP